MDEYDKAAVHFVVWDRMQRHWIGAMRLIYGGSDGLPSEKICRSSLDGLDDVRERSVEFSRLALIRDPGRVEHLTDSVTHNEYPLGTFETVPVCFAEEKNEALLRMLWVSFEWAAENSIDYCYFIVSAPLARMLKRFGIPLELVGTEVRHRGVRRPYRYNVHEAKDGMFRTLPRFACLAKNLTPYFPYSTFQQKLRTSAGTGKVRVLSCKPAIRTAGG